MAVIFHPSRTRAEAYFPPPGNTQAARPQPGKWYHFRMRNSYVILCSLFCTCLLARTGIAAPLAATTPLWQETGDLRQIEHRWLILEAGRPNSELVAPVTSSGPLKTVAVPSRARMDSETPAAADPSAEFRFDLAAASLFQVGQANGPFHDELAFVPANLPDPDQRLLVSAGFVARLSRDWTLWQRVRVDSDPLLDPASRTKEFHQIEASVEVPEAVLAYEREALAAWVGRRWERWGPGWTGSLIQEPGAPAPDGFGYSWTRNRWSARYRCGRLDDFGLGDELVSRFHAGHRLDLAVTSTWRIGLTETALVSSGTATPLWLLNPLLPWSLSQQEARGSSEGTNIFWSLDSIWNPTDRWAVYGQFLLDDFMIDVEDRDTYPDQLGFLAGLLWSGKRATTSQGFWRVGLEYSRIGTWTYVHREPDLRYRSWSGSLGHPSGPDSESVTLFYSRTGFAPPYLNRSGTGQTGFAMVWARFHRQGQVWLDTSLDSVGSPGLPWPTEPVSSWLQLGTALRVQPVSRLTATFRGGWTDGKPRLPAENLIGNPATVESSHGFWTSLTLSIPLLKFETDL